MLTAALNYIGMPEENDFGAMFVNLFNDFKVVRLSTYEDLKPDRLKICEPVKYEELIKEVQEYWDPSQTFLELRGLKVRLQKAVRQMCFFDEEKKFDKVLLQGREGIIDFPWAVQIVILQLPVPGWKQKPEWLRKADVLILNDSGDEESRDFIAKVKKLRPNLPVFTEKIQAGLSGELRDSLETLFSSYLVKREKIKDTLEEKYPGQTISCEQAHRLAGRLKVNMFLLGNVCDECGYRITRCSLGCF